MKTESIRDALERPGGSTRWFVCGLLFFATTINYVDRQTLSILKPVLQQEFHWTESDYGWIALAFQCAYALMMPVAGWLIDRLGVRLGYMLAVTTWSLVSMSHAFARGFWQFVLARFALGVTEAPNFPAAIRTVADWFPQKERSLATGIFNSGSNMGAIAAAFLVPYVLPRLGWQAAFLITGAIGLPFAIIWYVWFRKPTEHPRLSKRELSYILSDESSEPGVKIPYKKLLSNRSAMAFVVGKFVTDPVWWFYLTWIPAFLNSTYHVNVTQLGPPLFTIYIAADIGSIGGGWLFRAFASMGWTPNRARKTAMLICAVSATPVVLLLRVQDLWPAVGLISLAAAAHQGWSANLFTVVSDTFPRKAVGSVVGLGGMAGGISGMLVQPTVGYWLDFSHNLYGPIFVFAGTAYLVAFVLIHALVPKLERSEL